jgi:hypothetical protein
MHDWKQMTGFEWKQRSGGRLWQQGFYDHVLREENPVLGVVRYILNNPIRAGLVTEGQPYLLQARLDSATTSFVMR